MSQVMSSVFISLCHPFLPPICCLLPPPSLLSLSLNLSMFSSRLWNEDRYWVWGCASELHRKCISSSDDGRPKLWLLKHFFHGEMSNGCVMLDENNLYSVSCPSLFLLSAVYVCVCVSLCTWVTKPSASVFMHRSTKIFSYIHSHLCMCVSVWIWLCGFALISVNAHMYVCLRHSVCVCVHVRSASLSWVKSLNQWDPSHF